jgi:hypothetical protein
MLDGKLPTWSLVHRDHIKSVNICRPAKPDAPQVRHLGNGGLFPPAHRFQRRSISMASPGLDLHKGYHVSPSDYQINVMTTKLVSVILYFVAAGSEIGHGLSLTMKAENLPLVLPLFRGNELSSVHGKKVGDQEGEAVTRRMRHAAKRARGRRGTVSVDTSIAKTRKSETAKGKQLLLKQHAM